MEFLSQFDTNGHCRIYDLIDSIKSKETTSSYNMFPFPKFTHIVKWNQYTVHGWVDFSRISTKIKVCCIPVS